MLTIILVIIGTIGVIGIVGTLLAALLVGVLFWIGGLKR